MSHRRRRTASCGDPVAVALAAALLGVALAPPRADAQGAEEGKRVFETICVACHTVGAGVKIGPDLQGVTQRRSPDWLRRQIGDPEELFQAGDSLALANRARFAVAMPRLGLTQAQVEAVLAYLGQAEAAPAARPAAYLPTLVLAVLTAAGITLIALSFATKRVEVRA